MQGRICKSSWQFLKLHCLRFFPKEFVSHLPCTLSVWVMLSRLKYRLKNHPFNTCQLLLMLCSAKLQFTRMAQTTFGLAFFQFQYNQSFCSCVTVSFNWFWYQLMGTFVLKYFLKTDFPMRKSTLVVLYRQGAILLL